MNLTIPFLIEEMLEDLDTRLKAIRKRKPTDIVEGARNGAEYKVVRQWHAKLEDLKAEAKRNNCWR